MGGRAHLCRVVAGGYIDGTEQQSELGTSVALSRDGSRIIAGAPLRDSCATDSGAAVVYEWISSSWVQIGSELTTICEYQSGGYYSGRYQKFGGSVSIVADGNHVVVGSGAINNGEVRVFEWKSDHNLWHQKGLTMDNSAESANYNSNNCAHLPEWGFGNAVSISQYSKGTRVFVGIPKNVEVRVFHMTTCDDPVTAPAHGSMGDCVSTMSLGTTCQFGCDEGYRASGLTECSVAGVLSSATCLTSWDYYAYENGFWSDFGNTVAMSGDGNRAASVYFDGSVKTVVFQRVNSTAWEQLGDDITRYGGWSGMYSSEWPHVLSLSGDGSVLAVGYPSDNICRVYEWKSGNWTQLGGDIAQVTQATGSDYFGITISISSDGTRVAIGTLAGYRAITVFNFAANIWEPMGDAVDAAASWQGNYDFSPPAVSLSGDGNFLAVGVYEAGYAKVHRWVDGSWSQIGGNIEYPYPGKSIAIADGGVRVVIGSKFRNYDIPGYVAVYGFDSGTNSWSQLGSDLRGVINGEWFGNSVAISSDGNRVAVSGKYAKHFTEASVSGATYWGVVRVYDWVSDDDWIQQGLSVYGNDIPYTWASQHKGQFGNSLSISDDGLRLAVGEMSTSRMVMLEIPPWTQSVAPAPSSSSPGASPGASPEASPETPSNGDKPASQPAKEKKEKAEKTRDAILGDITNTRLKAKAKLLADAAIAGVKVKRLSAKLTADNEETACSTAFTKAGMSSGDGACVATAASSGKRRRLSSTTYDVELMFSSSTVSDDALAAAELEMKNNGVEGVSSDTAVDPIAELKTVPGVDTSKLQTFETEASDAATAAAESQTPPPPTPPPPPKPNLVLDDDDGAVHLRALTSALLASALTLVAFM